MLWILPYKSKLEYKMRILSACNYDKKHKRFCAHEKADENIYCVFPPSKTLLSFMVTMLSYAEYFYNRFWIEKVDFVSFQNTIKKAANVILRSIVTFVMIL